MVILKNVVSHYEKCFEPGHDEMLGRYRKFLNACAYSDEIMAEVLLIGDHQTRLNDIHSWRPFACEAIAVLAKNRVWTKTYANYEEIYKDTDGLIGHVKYIGPLAIYDVSLRLAARFNDPAMMPQKVYLHAGPLEAAKRLLGSGKKNRLSNVVDKKKFPKEFQELSCKDIEHLLCVMGHYGVFINLENLDKVPCLTNKGCCFMPPRLLGHVLLEKYWEKMPVPKSEIIPLRKRL